MKKIGIVLGMLIISLTMFSCGKGHGKKYEVINRQKGIMLVDGKTGEVFMMELKAEKGKGVVGSSWKKMGDPSMAK